MTMIWYHLLSQISTFLRMKPHLLFFRQPSSDTFAGKKYSLLFLTRPVNKPRNKKFGGNILVVIHLEGLLTHHSFNNHRYPFDWNLRIEKGYLQFTYSTAVILKTSIKNWYFLIWEQFILKLIWMEIDFPYKFQIGKQYASHTHIVHCFDGREEDKKMWSSLETHCYRYYSCSHIDEIW